MSPLVFDLGMNDCSPPFFGRDEEVYGETACLGCLLLTGIGLDGSTALSRDVDSDRRKWRELLLLMCERVSSAFESLRFLEKKDAFEAVIGVLGVLALTRRGGGVNCPSL